MTAMKSTGQATSSRPLRASERGPPRVAIQSQPMNAQLPAAATIAIIPQSSPPCGMRLSLLLGFGLQDGEERLLRDLDAADLLHALLARLLLLEQLPLARHVAAVALGEHGLAHCLHVLARDDVAADRRLHGDVEHLARDERAHARGEVAAAIARGLAGHDARDSVDALAVDEDVEAHHIAGPELLELVVERGVAARVALQLVEEVHHDLVQRHVVREDHLAADVLHVDLDPALLLPPP